MGVPQSALQMRLFEHNRARTLQNDAAGSPEDGRSRFVGCQRDLRLERESAGFGVIAHSDRRSAGLRNVKVDSLLGEGVARLLIEGKAAGLQVDRILQFLGSGLVGAGEARGIGLQIDLDFAFCNHIAGQRVVFELGAVDLVETAGIPAIERDGHVVELGAAPVCEFDRLASLNLKQSPRSVRARYGEAVRTLLDSKAHSRRYLLQRILHAVPGIEVRSANQQEGCHGAQREPATKLGDGKGHLKTSLLEGQTRSSRLRGGG